MGFPAISEQLPEFEPELLYSSNRVQVWCGDCLDVLPRIKTEHHLVVTDPPYGVDYQSHNRRKTDLLPKIPNDNSNALPLIHQTLDLMGPILRKHRHLYVFHPTDPQTLWGGTRLKIKSHTTLIWDKGLMSGGDIESPWGRSHEFIHFGYCGDGSRPNEGKVPTRLRKGSILRYTRATGSSIRHPTEKPIGLLKELIESSSRQDEWVMDPFGGIGSTGVAAILSGRCCTVIELTRQWADIAVQRVKMAEVIYRESMKV